MKYKSDATKILKKSKEWETIFDERKQEFLTLKEYNKHWGYIILDLGLHLPYSKPKSKLKYDVQKHGFTAFIQPLFLPEAGGVGYENSIRLPNGFYTIRFENWIRNDKLAQRIVDALWAGLAMMRRVDFFEETPLALCVPKCLLNSGNNINIETFVAWNEIDNKTPFTPDFLLYRLNRRINFDSGVISKVWKILPALMQTNIFNAAQFIMASVQDFNFCGDDAAMIVRHPDMLPMSFLEQVRAEGAVLNAYKAIESLIGDPPKDDTKLSKKLISIGVDPNKLLGFNNKTKEPILKVLRRLNEYRDKKAAHGSTPFPRETKYLDIYEFQECALFLIWASIEHYQKHNFKRQIS